MDRSNGPPEAVSVTTVSRDEVRSLLEGRHGDPFGVLGPHVVEVDGESYVSFRVLLPGAVSVEALVDEPTDTSGPEVVDLTLTDSVGFFEGLYASTSCPSYRLRATTPEGVTWDFEDPYRFGSFISDHDLHLFCEGSLLRSYERLGAHLIDVCGIKGVHFAVWAPNAERVSVVGDFNSWDGRRHPMRRLGESGCWEIFIPGVSEGDLYKFEIRTRAGDLRIKSDPYGFHAEYRPGTSTVVADVDSYSWDDSTWMSNRTRRDWLREPVSIYEVHLGSWMRLPDEDNLFLTYRELAPRLVDYVKDMGFTHIELLPIQEHPLDASWGYQATGFFAPTSRHGTPKDFMYFVDYCHNHGIGVILDWVPAHFPKDDHSLRLFDGTHLYEHADPRQGEHKDWGTLIFNYGRNEVKSFLLSSAVYWLDKYHLDGLRVDAVASMLYLDYSKREGEWIPNQYGGKDNLEAIEFIKRLNYECHRYFPGILTVAEESTSWPGVSHPTDVDGLGFSMKWNMGWMNDSLSYFQKDSLFRKYHQQKLTFSLLYAFTENFVLPLSHDEVVHGKRSLIEKMPGDAWQKFANLRLLLGFQYCHPGKKLLFMGGEFGMGREWSVDTSLDWHLLESDTGLHRGVQRFVRDLNRLYREVPALHQVDFGWQGFDWIDFRDCEHSVVSFLRRSDNPRGEILAVLNFTPELHISYRLGVPEGGEYEELLNSDATEYCGSGAGNLGRIRAEPVASHGHEHSLSLTVPPLSAIVLRRKP